MQKTIPRYCQWCKTYTLHDPITDKIVEDCLCNETKQKTLVIFAPGWADPSAVIDVLATRFTQHLPQYDQITLSYPFRGLNLTTKQIASAQAPMLKVLRGSYDNIIAVGHSYGGLVLRALSEHIKLDKLITIATPHQGTQLAKLVPSKISPSINEMKNTDNTLPIPNCPKLTIQASFDPLIWPQSSATKLKGAENIVIPNTEHITVATSKRTFWEIYAWLEYEKPHESTHYLSKRFNKVT